MSEAILIDCPRCSGSGFSGYGTGYGDVCSECGGQRRVLVDREPMPSVILSPHRFYLVCERRDDGGLRVSCPEVPGLALSHGDPEKVMRDVIPAINAIERHNRKRN
jgi:hypothetical protein